MLRKRKQIIAILILILIFIITIIINQDKILFLVRKQIVRMSQEAIDNSTGIINNDYFGIFNDGTNSEETTKGINEAIEYANKNNIEYIKLINGTYLIDGIADANQTSGIILLSNITLDLNGSIIKQEKNASESYITISIHSCINVEVCNGTIIGDRDEHDFKDHSSSEWGHNVSIISSKNVNLNNLDIYNAIGDGIYISEIYSSDNNKEYATQEIRIFNNTIHDNRRQGISIVSGSNIDIYNNIIYDIEGTAPQSGIDLESNSYPQSIENIKIYSNKFYNFRSRNAIKVNRYTVSVEITDNEINGNIYGYECKEKVYISNNIIKDGTILFEYKENYAVNELTITNNNLINTNINVSDIKSLKINNNIFLNGQILITACNCEINNNVVEDQKVLLIYLKTREPEMNQQYIAMINNDNINIIVDQEESYIINNDEKSEER